MEVPLEEGLWQSSEVSNGRLKRGYTSAGTAYGLIADQVAEWML